MPKKDKVLSKENKELILLHKRVCKTYLIQHNIKLKNRRNFVKVYDFYIDSDNIRNYFFRDISLFIYCLIRNQLDNITDYFHKKPQK